jgi:hypothetical protein
MESQETILIAAIETLNTMEEIAKNPTKINTSDLAFNM